MEIDWKQTENLIERQIKKLTHELSSRESYAHANYKSGGKWGSYEEAKKELESWEKSLLEYTIPSKEIIHIEVTNDLEIGTTYYHFVFRERGNATLEVKDGCIIYSGGETLAKNWLAAFRFIGTNKFKDKG